MVDKLAEQQENEAILREFFGNADSQYISYSDGGIAYRDDYADKGEYAGRATRVAARDDLVKFIRTCPEGMKVTLKDYFFAQDVVKFAQASTDTSDLFATMGPQHEENTEATLLAKWKEKNGIKNGYNDLDVNEYGVRDYSKHKFFNNARQYTDEYMDKKIANFLMINPRGIEATPDEFGFFELIRERAREQEYNRKLQADKQNEVKAQEEIPQQEAPQKEKRRTWTEYVREKAGKMVSSISEAAKSAGTAVYDAASAGYESIKKDVTDLNKPQEKEKIWPGSYEMPMYNNKAEIPAWLKNASNERLIDNAMAAMETLEFIKQRNLKSGTDYKHDPQYHSWGQRILDTFNERCTRCRDGRMSYEEDGELCDAWLKAPENQPEPRTWAEFAKQMVSKVYNAAAETARIAANAVSAGIKTFVEPELER